MYVRLIWVVGFLTLVRGLKQITDEKNHVLNNLSTTKFIKTQKKSSKP